MYYGFPIVYLYFFYLWFLTAHLSSLAGRLGLGSGVWELGAGGVRVAPPHQVIMAFNCLPLLELTCALWLSNCLPLLELTYVLWLSIVYLYWNLPMYYGFRSPRRWLNPAVALPALAPKHARR